MGDTTQFTIGTEVSGSDGPIGKLSRVIVDPTVEEVTHLAVEPEHRPDLGRLVPLELVEFGGTASGIRLRCTKAEFENFDPAEDTQIIPASDAYGGYGAGQIGYMPYYGLEGSAMAVPGMGGGAGAMEPQVVATDSVPLGEVEIRRGESVQATDGDIGRVQGLVIDPGSRHVTHVLLQEGHLWGKKEVAIPISAVASTRDGIQLTITKRQVGDLPPVDARHPEKKALNHSSERTVGDCAAGQPGLRRPITAIRFFLLFIPRCDG
jgi:sporulation protein YlmC with PRC-barrel domain